VGGGGKSGWEHWLGLARNWNTGETRLGVLTLKVKRLSRGNTGHRKRPGTASTILIRGTTHGQTKKKKRSTARGIQQVKALARSTPSAYRGGRRLGKKERNSWPQKTVERMKSRAEQCPNYEIRRPQIKGRTALRTKGSDKVGQRNGREILIKTGYALIKASKREAEQKDLGVGKNVELDHRLQ